MPCGLPLRPGLAHETSVEIWLRTRDQRVSGHIRQKARDARSRSELVEIELSNRCPFKNGLPTYRPVFDRTPSASLNHGSRSARTTSSSHSGPDPRWVTELEVEAAVAKT